MTRAGGCLEGVEPAYLGVEFRQLGVPALLDDPAVTQHRPGLRHQAGLFGGTCPPVFPPEPPGPEEPRRCYRSLWPGGLRLELGPGVPEAEGAVEDEPSGRRVGIRAEVAEALELHGLTDGQFRERRLD